MAAPTMFLKLPLDLSDPMSHLKSGQIEQGRLILPQRDAIPAAVFERLNWSQELRRSNHIPRAEPGALFMSRSKQLKGVANAAPAIKNHLKVVQGQYCSMAHNDRLLKWLGGLRREAMQRPFLGPLAHLALDDPGVDPVAPWLECFLGNLLYQPVVPAATAARAGRTLGQAAAQDFQRRGQRQSPQVQVLSGGGFVHQHPHPIVGQQQAIDLLDHSGRGLAAQHRAFALMGLEFRSSSSRASFSSPRSW